MKILFIQKDLFAKPAIMALSAVLKKAGHPCDIVVDDLEKNAVRSALKRDPDIIAFSITTGEYLWMKKTGETLRNKNFRKNIICGGVHPTFYPEIINDDYMDAICIGEGEGAFVEYVNALEKGEDLTGIENFHVKRNGRIFKNQLRPLISNLDTLPFYDRKIYNRYKLYKNSHNCILFHNILMTSRGCPHQCAFCFNKLYKELYKRGGRIFRRRSVAHVIEELKEMLQEKRLTFLSIEDDSFLIPPRHWLYDFLDAYKKEINIPFKILTPANYVDEDIVKRLKEANCYSIKFGVETGNEDYRINVLHKKVTNKDIMTAASLAKKYGIRLQTYNIMGNPNETLEMALETFDLNRKINPDFVWCSLLNPYPGTEIFDYAFNGGCLEESFTFEDIKYSYFTDTPIKLKNKREICNLQKIINLAVLLHFPRWLVIKIIKFPFSRLYPFFLVGFFVGVLRINKIGLISLIKHSILRFRKYI